MNLGMVCTCSERGKAAAEELLAEVHRRLAAGSDRLRAHLVTDRLFMTDAVRSFHHDFGVSIELICDQWFAVIGTDGDDQTTIVQCDEVEHGVAALWRHYANNAGFP